MNHFWKKEAMLLVVKVVKAVDELSDIDDQYSIV